MKILKSLFVLFAVVSLVSCNSDDDNNHYILNNSNLEGLYKINHFGSTEVKTTIVDGFVVEKTTTSVGDTFEVDFTFTENGTYNVDGLFRDVFTVVVNGVLDEEQSGSDIIEINNEGGNYSTNDASMTIVLDGEVYDVTLFNENEIRFTFEEMWEENGSEFVYSEEIRLERQ